MLQIYAINMIIGSVIYSIPWLEITIIHFASPPNVILVSIHVNAAGNDSKWMTATGWSCYTSKGQTQSDKLAECLYEAAIKNFPGKRIRTDKSDGDPDWEESFYILRKTLCPAVLTENFFMDNHSDLVYLKSRAGKQAIIDTHVEGITEYLTR